MALFSTHASELGPFLKKTALHFSHQNVVFIVTMWPMLIDLFAGKNRNINQLWIRIRIHLADLDPDPYWECGLGNGSNEIDKNLQIFNKPGLLPFERAFLPSHVWFLPFTYFIYILNVKNILFVTLKFDQDPDPDPHWVGSLAPDP